MARWKRTSAEIKAKVIEEKINNPDLSSRDIEERTWINYRTSSRIINEELSQVVSQSERVAELIDMNNDLQSLADERIKQLLASWEETIRISELVQVRESTFKQNQLLTGKPTERTSVNIVKDMSDDELLKMLW